MKPKPHQNPAWDELTAWLWQCWRTKTQNVQYCLLKQLGHGSLSKKFPPATFVSPTPPCTYSSSQQRASQSPSPGLPNSSPPVSTPTITLRQWLFYDDRTHAHIHTYIHTYTPYLHYLVVSAVVNQLVRSFWIFSFILRVRLLARSAHKTQSCWTRKSRIDMRAFNTTYTSADPPK